MSKEIIPISNNLPESIKKKAEDLLSELALKRATEYIRRYETETNAMLFSQGLIAIRDMVSYVDKYHSEISYQKLELIINELKFRVKEVDKIICKIRGKRSMTSLSDDDKKTVLEIEKALKVILNTKNNISLKNIVPFMIESSSNKL